MRDLVHSLGLLQSVKPQVLAATDVGAAIDLLGFNSATVIITTGAIVGACDYTAKLQESDTTTSSDFTDVVAADLLGTFPASLVADSLVKVGYAGNKRYVRTVVTKNSGTSIAAAALIVKGHADTRPVT
ncbi:hypothetical protein [Zavarzinia sp.]|uniref:hypothetical protein n=1 Tax=Zavarzinia sp. TaxID=2027920 RepID=UPI003561E469